MRVLAPNYFQAAMGQLGLIGKAMTSALQANVATLVGSYPC